MLTIQKRGTFSLNIPAFRSLGEPEVVELLYDRDKRLIALGKVSSDTSHGYPVRPLGKSTYMVSGKAFLNFYGIPFGVAQRYVAHAESDGLLVVDLNQTPIEVTGPGNRRQVDEPELPERSPLFG